MALNINGTTGISGVDGSASAPALQGSDSNTGVSFGSDTVNIVTGGSTRATVNSSGNVGIGTTSPATAMHIRNADDPVTITLQNSDSNTPTDSGGEIIFKGTKENGDPVFFGGVGGRRRNQASDVTGYLALYRQNGDGSNNAVEGLRIDHNGNVGIGNNASFPVYTHINSRNFMLGTGGESTAIQIHSSSTTYGGIYFGDVADRTDANSYIGSIEYKHGDDFMNFRTNGAERLKINSSGGFEHTSADNTAYKVSIAGAVRFQVVHSGGGNMVLSNPSSGNVTYSTSSDYRLKENVSTINNALTTVKSLKPYQFTWKHDSTIAQGFFAHEVLETTPNSQAALGTKDAVDSEDNPIYQQVDYSKLVPLLTAALQEAIAKIEVLETKVAALEAG